MLQPFEPELNWSSFSVPVPESDIPHLHEILEEMGNERSLGSLWIKLKCAAQHMIYSSITGGVLGDDGAMECQEWAGDGSKGKESIVQQCHDVFLRLQESIMCP